MSSRSSSRSSTIDSSLLPFAPISSSDDIMVAHEKREIEHGKQVIQLDDLMLPEMDTSAIPVSPTSSVMTLERKVYKGILALEFFNVCTVEQLKSKDQENGECNLILQCKRSLHVFFSFFNQVAKIESIEIWSYHKLYQVRINWAANEELFARSTPENGFLPSDDMFKKHRTEEILRIAIKRAQEDALNSENTMLMGDDRLEQIKSMYADQANQNAEEFAKMEYALETTEKSNDNLRKQVRSRQVQLEEAESKVEKINVELAEKQRQLALQCSFNGKLKEKLSQKHEELQYVGSRCVELENELKTTEKTAEEYKKKYSLKRKYAETVVEEKENLKEQLLKRQKIEETTGNAKCKEQEIIQEENQTLKRELGSAHQAQNAMKVEMTKQSCEIQEFTHELQQERHKNRALQARVDRLESDKCLVELAHIDFESLVYEELMKHGCFNAVALIRDLRIADGLNQNTDWTE